MSIRDLQKKLWEKMKHWEGKNQKEYSLHFPIIGERYLDNKIKLMVVGRATNGWGLNQLKEIETADDIRTISFLDWKRKKEDVKKREIDIQKEVMNKSAFWRTNKGVYSNLAKDEDSPEWYENIIWANLFMIAPSNGGNPGTLLCKAQREYCGEILNAYIGQYKPTHILFVTGYKNWFEWFNWFDWTDNSNSRNILNFVPRDDVLCDQKNIAKVGWIGDAKVVVANRPDNNRLIISEQEYVEKIIEAYGQLNEK